MPRNGSNVYSPPSGTTATSGTTISSARFNAFVADVTTDLNLPRPIVAGGTGASTADGALTALGLTATAAELNTLDGITATTAELNILDGVTATTAELNALDGVTAAGTALITGADAAAQRTSLGLGTAALESVSGMQLGQIWTSNSTELTLTPVIPIDGSIPQITEGTQVLSASITPKKTGSTIVVDVYLSMADADGVGRSMGVALFQNGGANAVISTGRLLETLDYFQGSMSLRFVTTSASTSPIAFAVRCGPNGGTMYINHVRASGAGVGPYGRGIAYMTITEIAA